MDGKNQNLHTPQLTSVPEHGTNNGAPESHNFLGTFVRTHRKSLGRTLAQISSDANCSLTYLSRLELGQLADGPTLDLLRRLSVALGVDVIKLVQLKEEDAKAVMETRGDPEEEATPITDLERRMVLNFRAADDRFQHYLVEQAQLSRTIKSRSKEVPDVAFLHLDAVPDQMVPLLERLARDYEAVGEKLQFLQRLTEAVAAYENAQKLYTQLDWLGSVARTWFFIGRISRYLSRDREGKKDEQELRYHFASADHCFGWADRLFLEAEERSQNAPFRDNEKERVPENLTQWALNDLQMARLIARDVNATPDYSLATFRFYKKRADQKQHRALGLYLAWIQELEERLEDAGTGGSEGVQEMLAEAFHRKANIHVNIAAEEIRYLEAVRKYDVTPRSKSLDGEQPAESEAQALEEAAAQYALCHATFRQAIQLRRTLALEADGLEKRELQLKNLANNHQAFGYATHHYAPAAIQYEHALYHFLLAEKIDALLAPDYAPEQRKAITLLSATLEHDNNLGEDMRAAIRRRVETLVNQANIGTAEELKLMYEVDYPGSLTTP